MKIKRVKFIDAVCVNGVNEYSLTQEKAEMIYEEGALLIKAKGKRLIVPQGNLCYLEVDTDPQGSQKPVAGQPGKKPA